MFLFRCLTPLRLHRQGRVRAMVVLAAASLIAGCAGIAQRPVPPRVEVAGLQGAMLAGNALTLVVALKVTNPNPFPIAIDALEADVTLEGTPAAAGRLPAPVTLAASGETRVDVEARADVHVLTGILERVLRRGRMSYEVTGVLVALDGRRLNFSKRGDLNAGDLLGRRQ
ncbi:MAG: LEA type 2 family protein [Betaproteobacteria bacterium]